MGSRAVSCFLFLPRSFRRALVAEEEHRHRAGAGGPFFALFGAYQRTVRGAAAKELNVAVASVSTSTCVLPSSAAYMLCSSG